MFSLTKKDINTMIRNVLTTCQPVEETEESRRLLKPLLDGKPVAIKDTQLYKRRVEHPTIFIMPLEAAGIDEPKLLVSVPGYGSEIIDIRHPKVTPLIRVGLSVQTSNVLIAELRNLYEVKENA